MQPRWSSGIILLGTALIAGGGCVDLGEDGADSKYPTVEKFCEAKAKEECVVAAICVVPESACIARRKSECADFAAANMSAKRPYRPSSVQACLDKTRAVYTKPGAITPEDLSAMNDLCARVFRGDVKSPEPCTIDYDCTGTLICDKMRCALRVVKNSGDLCGNPGEVCAAGSICVPDADRIYQCVPKQALGAACDASTPCRESYRCLAGTCQNRLPLASPCTSHDDCAAEAPYCDPYIDNKCSTGLRFASGAPSCTGYGG